MITDCIIRSTIGFGAGGQPIYLYAKKRGKDWQTTMAVDNAHVIDRKFDADTECKELNKANFAGAHWEVVKK